MTDKYLEMTTKFTYLSNVFKIPALTGNGKAASNARLWKQIDRLNKSSARIVFVYNFLFRLKIVANERIRSKHGGLYR